jgi:glucose uptake protein
MTLATTYAAALLITIFSMICWGSWANSFKLTGKWRFELFYFDFSIGVLVAAGVIALTFGMLGSDGFVLLDDLMRAGKRNMAYAFAAGMVFNLGNILLVAAISLAGLSVAFPIGIGLAMVIGAVWNHITGPQGNPALISTGVAAIVLAIVVDALAYRSRGMLKEVAKMKAGEHRTLRPSVSWKGVLLSLASGVLIGCFYPLVEMAKAGETGLGPYAVGLIFCLGLFCSTFVYNLYFMNLPVQGPPLEVLDYFRGLPKQHLLGALGGMVWCAGTMTNFVAASTPPEVHVGPAITYAMGQGATMLSALWGILVWKEFAGSDAKVKALLVLMFFLFLSGLGLLSLAPLYVAK